jgi:chromosome partitioning protein
MPIISIANSKGGSAKTTLCTALAVNLARDGYRVAVIDADINGTFTTWHRSATTPPLTATACPDHNKIVKHAYEQAETHDICLVDCAGFSNQTAIFACGASDLVLIPVTPDRGSVIEAKRTAGQVENVAQIARREIPYRVVLSRWTPRGLAEKATLDDLAAAQLPYLEQHVPALTAFAKSSFSGDMPTTGYIGLIVSKLIEEIIGVGAFTLQRANGHTAPTPDNGLTGATAAGGDKGNVPPKGDMPYDGNRADTRRTHDIEVTGDTR